MEETWQSDSGRGVRIRFSKNVLLEDPFWLLKMTTCPHIPEYVNTECPGDWYQKLHIYISELVVDKY